MQRLYKDGYLANPQQVFTLRRVAIEDGRAKGCSVIEVCTADGLALDILPDAGMDIGQVRYKGVNVSFISKNGYDHPAAILPYETEFMHVFPGGMLYTSGLRNVGPAHRDGNEWQPLHGRYHSLRAEHIVTDVEDDTIVVKGTVRETALFGHLLELKRTIRIPIFGSSVTVTDVLSNLTPKDEEYALLYHCNFGFPLVSADAEVVLPRERKTTARTDFAATGLGQACTFHAPTPGEEERVFFHREMQHQAALINPTVGMQMKMSWSENLPILAHWQSMASGDYVCGLEPTNCYIMGRKQERQNKTLPTIKAFETIETEVVFSFATLKD